MKNYTGESGSSIHIENVKSTSEEHNLRLKKFDYVREDLTPKNENLVIEWIADARARIEKTYREHVKQKVQAKMKPIKEGVVNIKSSTTMEDLKRLAIEIEKRFGLKTIQIHIHRDEGSWRKGQWRPNLHAHMVFDYTNEQGKAIKLNGIDLCELQTITAEVLEMKRGISSSKKHLNAIQYKVKKIEEEREQLQEEVEDIKEEVEVEKGLLKEFKILKKQAQEDIAKLKMEYQGINNTLFDLRQVLFDEKGYYRPEVGRRYGRCLGAINELLPLEALPQLFSVLEVKEQHNIPPDAWDKEAQLAVKYFIEDWKKFCQSYPKKEIKQAPPTPKQNKGRSL